MQMPQVDVRGESARLDFWTRRMRIEAHNAEKRMETLSHVHMLLERLQDGSISTSLAMRWLQRIETANRGGRPLS